MLGIDPKIKPKEAAYRLVLMPIMLKIQLWQKKENQGVLNACELLVISNSVRRVCHVLRELGARNMVMVSTQ